MKSSEVAELKRRSVTSEKNHADSLQAELRTTRNKLDEYLENSFKQEQDTKMLLMKVLTSLQVAAVKDSNKLEYKAQSQQMQQRNEKERFTGLQINDKHNFSNIMQQFSAYMGTSSMGHQQAPWQQQSIVNDADDAAGTTQLYDAAAAAVNDANDAAAQFSRQMG